jgi:hypothetical protein
LTIELEGDLVVELLLRRGERISNPRLLDAARRSGVPFREVPASGTDPVAYALETAAADAVVA